jgi:hypothetical protein
MTAAGVGCVGGEVCRRAAVELGSDKDGGAQRSLWRARSIDV